MTHLRLAPNFLSITRGQIRKLMSTWPKLNRALHARPGRVVWAGVTAPNAQTFRVFGALVSKNCLNCVLSPSEEGRKRVTRARARPLLLKCAFT